jgi:ferric-dicitrate binding protein FerR (iron transport regulator)
MTRDPQHRALDEGGDEQVAELYRMAGRPPELPTQEVAAIREQARQVWRRQVRARALRRRSLWAAAAVAACLALVFVFLPRGGAPRPDPPSAGVASVARSTGTVTIRSAAPTGGESGPLIPGTLVTTGGDARVCLTLVAGGSLRLDRDSRVRLESRHSLVLERGALYLDSGREGGGSVSVVTPLGVVTDVGTRFEVRLLEAGGDSTRRLVVKVRDGEVQIEGAAGGEYSAGGGSQLTLVTEGAPRRQAIAADDPAWRWAAEVAPAPLIEGRSLASFLDWATREMGIRWTVVEPAPEPTPEAIVLHGSVEGLTPEEALEVVLTGSGLRYRRFGGEVRLSAAAED